MILNYQKKIFTQKCKNFLCKKEKEKEKEINGPGDTCQNMYFGPGPACGPTSLSPARAHYIQRARPGRAGPFATITGWVGPFIVYFEAGPRARAQIDNTKPMVIVLILRHKWDIPQNFQI